MSPTFIVEFCCAPAPMALPTGSVLILALHYTTNKAGLACIISLGRRGVVFRVT